MRLLLMSFIILGCCNFWHSSAYAGSFEVESHLRPGVSYLQSVYESHLTSATPIYGNYPDITHSVALSATVLTDNQWDIGTVEARLIRVAAVYLQCGIHINEIIIYSGERSRIDGLKRFLGGDSNIIGNPFTSPGMIRITEALTEAEIHSRPMLIYVQEQRYSTYGAAFISSEYQDSRRNTAIIPYSYEEIAASIEDNLHLVTRDYLGEAHELGHLLGLTHNSRSGLMYFSFGDAIRGLSSPQSNQIEYWDCLEIKKSPLLTQIK